MDNEQDWTPVVLKRRKPKTQIVPKQTNHEGQRLKKLENDEIYVKPKKLSKESIATIVNFRIDNMLSQSDLDARCGFPRNTIQLFESNKLSPNTGQLQQLNKILKTGLSLTD